MLKVLLAPNIPDSFLSAPRGRYQGASQLAEISGVSMMSAFRFVEQFSKEGFLEQEGDGLRLVRVKELMERWQGRRWLPKDTDGATKPEKLTFTVTGKGTGTGSITGTMAFDRKEYGMNSGIPFIKIADRVEVTVDLKGKRVSGPPVVFKQ